MKLNVYVLRDKLAGISNVILTANNDEVLKRDIKGVLLSKNQNVINTNTEDKDVFLAAVLDTDTGIIKALDVPVFTLNVELVRKELIQEIKIKQAEAGLEPTGEVDVPEGEVAHE